MGKRKLRFNPVDVFILLIIAAIAFAVLYIFVFSEKGTQSAQVNYKTIRYVVEINDVDDYLDEVVKKGQPVEDAIKRKKIGTVSGIQAVPYELLTFDYVTGKETIAAVDGKMVLKISIEAQALETDRAFTVDGCEIRVGQQYSLILPDFYGAGYCTELVCD